MFSFFSLSFIKQVVGRSRINFSRQEEAEKRKYKRERERERENVPGTKTEEIIMEI